MAVTTEELAALAKARQQPTPTHLSPQLATLVDEVPGGEDWVYEPKYDGYRLLCHVTSGGLKQGLDGKVFSLRGRAPLRYR